MASFTDTWERLGSAARGGIILGIVTIVGGMVALGLWAYRPDYQVLFSDVAARDAASMTAELDRMKTPYQLADGGNTILVPRELVYKTRLKLMAKDLPLHGAVGFEVFNNADFGMTEFVQKVNYLRAIQGELTRTILSIDDIVAARVHLAIPEQGLFKKATTKPKASVTISTKPGHVLDAEQIAGIQRLVAASVADIVPADVTVLDQRGVALTRVAQADGETETSVTQLDAKRSTEDYLVKKITAVLDRTFGAGAAVASVDVLLNLDQSKVTTEEVLPAHRGAVDPNPSGVLVRSRLSTHEGAAMTPASPLDKSGATGATNTESDYQVGRRVEQLVVASGTVRRMTVAVMVKQPLSEAQIDKLKEVVASAVGLNSARGDAVVVTSMESFADAGVGPTGGTVDGAAPMMPKLPPESAPRAAKAPAARDTATTVIWVLGALLGLVGVIALLYAQRRGDAPRVAPRLSADERARVLSDVRRWIATPGDIDGGRR